MKKRKMNVLICVTGQHREMMDQMLETFSLQPDFDLQLMEPDQSLNTLSGKIFSEIDKIFDNVEPDLVMVQGDTTTATIVAQAAFHRKIKVAHIEAGLRTYQRYSPFPEEINRQLITRLANYHFTPTSKATKNLVSEGIDQGSICESGNTVVDALKLIEKKIQNFDFLSEFGFNLEKFRKMILVTGHRRENFGKGMQELCHALVELARDQNLLIVFPVHLNPNIKIVVEQRLRGYKNIKLLPPVKYDQMLALLKRCDLVISDSGGIQEEAPAFKKPVIVTREFTERHEAVEAGFSMLTGSDSMKILQVAMKLLQNTAGFKNTPNPFGDGRAAMRIVDFFEKNKWL
ncbi:non-hydrolyzing UDP-N-acetylglucosamine 2-epimerase [Christiangramia sp. OXR-203]|uniref:non-hydrolyzing UDP-N-acetylglucosamine 2-epimerase n=1 Tax=Christiangramia sp. OXR-203 TaxID=3100176 RepID=UPI002AC936EB|nr:UDP-N-acetylglucosamine 2-epimerase (non-hydrolyzing) [Christiangramia sp. OXR-203]WPY97902.1 UDP-N-acetylglucosamine 2-epimerase (non-hydrolyzing) [Christiangramia sp. OXR-203]